MKSTTLLLIAGFHSAAPRFIRNRVCRFTRNVFWHDVRSYRRRLLREHREMIAERGRNGLREFHIEMAQIMKSKPEPIYAGPDSTVKKPSGVRAA